MARLLVVATPIGNLNDLTPRMREALACADLIAAEDTRVTMKLLNRMELKKPLVSCHRHNEDARAPQLVERMLSEDLTVALTCDAGTPAISDPGHALVRAAWEADIRRDAHLRAFSGDHGALSGGLRRAANSPFTAFCRAKKRRFPKSSMPCAPRACR